MTLSISFEDGQWYASGVPYEEGTVRAHRLEVHSGDLPALCVALDLVPERALEIVAARCSMMETGLTKGRGLRQIMADALDEAAKEARNDR